MTEAVFEDVLRKLLEKHREAEKSLGELKNYFEVLMNAARDIGELRNCGCKDDLGNAEGQLRAAFAQLAASQKVLEDYLRESTDVQKRLTEAVREEEEEEEAEEGEGGGEQSRRQEAQKEERIMRRINSAAKQLSRFPVLASEPENAGADPKKHPLYAQFNAKLAVCPQQEAERPQHKQSKLSLHREPSARAQTRTACS